MKEVDFFLPLKLGWFTQGLFEKENIFYPNACCSKTHERYGTSSFQRIWCGLGPDLVNPIII